MSTRSTKIVGDVCLYGNQSIGHGFIATADGQLFGDGEPRPLWSATEAMWAGLERITRYGIRKGTVRVFAPGGARVALVSLEKVRPYYGDLLWAPAPFLVIEPAAIEAAPQKE